MNDREFWQGSAILFAFLTNGVIRKENGEYIGTASDGVEVDLGTDVEFLCKYLANHPTPDTW